MRLTRTLMKKQKSKFKPFVTQCVHCKDLLLLVRPRMYITCGCKKTSVDAGDGYYMRYNCIDIPTEYWTYYPKRRKMVGVLKYLNPKK